MCQEARPSPPTRYTYRSLSHTHILSRSLSFSLSRSSTLSLPLTLTCSLSFHPTHSHSHSHSHPHSHSRFFVDEQMLINGAYHTLALNLSMNTRTFIRYSNFPCINLSKIAFRFFMNVCPPVRPVPASLSHTHTRTLSLSPSLFSPLSSLSPPSVSLSLPLSLPPG